MRGMILAAGKGTRLRPFTDKIPKALLTIQNKSLLEYAIQYLKHFGVDELIINVHHFADQIISFLEEHDNFGIHIEISDERDELMDTGGGLKKASWFFNDGQPFVLMAVDIITDLDLMKMYHHHNKRGSLVSLAVKSRKSTRNLLFDNDFQLCGWRSNVTGETRFVDGYTNFANSIAFSGIHIIHPDIFRYITEAGPFSIIDLYLQLAGTQKIIGFTHDNSVWMEFGRIKNLKAAEQSNEFRKVINYFS
jgi:NDP-sugar pyrophosphorylase family protein